MNLPALYRVGAFLFSSFGIAAVFAPGPTSEYTGYTRPGWPADVREGNEIRFAADDPELRDRAIGGTVYYTVLALSGKAGDSWDSGLERFNQAFHAGIDFNGASSPGLDTGAKYLYLYQVVNDRKTPSPILSVSVKLIVDPVDVTSWGHFDGIGFAAGVRAEKEGAAEQIRPVSFNNVLVGGLLEKLYKSPAAAITSPKPLVLTRVPTRLGEEAPKAKDEERVVRVAWDALDPALNPNHVMLLHVSDFNQRPCFRAVWSNENGIKKDVRSTVFGFTSNWPPTYEPVRIRGVKNAAKAGGGIKPAAERPAFKEEDNQPDGGSGFTGAEGKAPTPKPGVPTAFDTAGEPDPRPQLPLGFPAFGPGTNMGGMPLAGLGAGPSAGAGSGGGGGAGAPLIIPGGTSSSGGTTVVQPTTSTASAGAGAQTINFNPILINQQFQGQAQAQLQGQLQGQFQSQSNQNRNRNHGGGVSHEVVPAPEALWLASMALPFLLLSLRRRFKAAQPV